MASAHPRECRRGLTALLVGCQQIHGKTGFVLLAMPSKRSGSCGVMKNLREPTNLDLV
jgi:hypothetical protein